MGAWGAGRRRRLFCPHRLGRNKDGQLRVLCYQYGGESESGLKPIGSRDNWRPEPLTSGILYCRGRRGRRRLCGARRPAAGTVRQASDKPSGNDDSYGGDRVRIMPLGAYAASLAGESLVMVWGRVV